MIKQIYSCFNKNIKLIANDISIDLAKLEFWLKRDCPNVKTLNNDEKVEHSIICENSTIEPQCITNNISTILKGDFKECETWFAKFISQMFQKLLIEDGIIFLNSSCVAFNKEAILILGDFGQGKTSTAIGVCEYFKKSILLSDNYVAVKNSCIIGITDYLSVRNENNYVQNKIDYNDLVLNINNRDFYKTKVNKNIDYKIKKIIVPFVNVGDENFHIISKEESSWYLYQKLCRLINGETVLFNGSLPSPILNNEVISKKILDISNNYLINNNILYASSSVENIAKYICNILGWNNE